MRYYKVNWSIIGTRYYKCPHQDRAVAYLESFPCASWIEIRKGDIPSRLPVVRIP